ncbi:MAG: hypothetical protein WDN69_16620 [Aliidongia sp.]
MPGQTAPWYGTTIYARVDGYVGKWVSDIGDHVEAGQVLATIEDAGTRCRARCRPRQAQRRGGRCAGARGRGALRRKHL